MKRQVRDAVDFFDTDMATCTDSLAVHHWQILKAELAQKTTNTGSQKCTCRVDGIDPATKIAYIEINSDCPFHASALWA